MAFFSSIPLTLLAYMSRKYAKILFLTLLVLISFISFIEIIELLRRAGQKAPELSSMYVVFLGIINIPTLVDKILPFAVLFGSMICFYLWGRSHEFLVGRTTGQNIWQALLPVIATVFAFGLFHITVFNPIAATTAKQYEYLMGEIFGNDRRSELSVSTNGIWMRDLEDGNNFIINGATLMVEKSLIRSPLIYKIKKDGLLDWRIKADEMRLVNGSWIISNAIRIQNDGQRVFLGDVMFPTALKLSDLAESKLPPKTVSIYNFPNFIAVQKRAGLPVNQHLVFFHQLLSTPFKLIGLAMLAASFTLLHFSRQTKIRLIVLGLGSGFVVYFLSDIVYLLGNTAKLPYVLAGWAPALLICLFSGFLLARVDE